MAANHLTKAASCSSNISGRHWYSLRSAHLEDDAELKSAQSYENNPSDDYAANFVISEAISDQSSSANASNCDQKQVEIKSRILIKDVFNSRKEKQEVQGGSYGELQQEINMENDPRHNSAKDGDGSPCYGGIGATFGASARDRGGRIGCLNASLSAVARDSAADSISRGDTCTAVGGGDRHSSSSEGICVGDRGCSRSANAKHIDGARAVGYAATAAFAESAGNGAGVEISMGCAAAAGKMRRRKKFVGVRQRPSGRWVAEIKDTTQKIRMWLGTFDTAEDAARAYDEAACLLRGSNTRTNFNIPSAPSSPSSSPLASRLAHMLRARQNQNITSASSSPSSPPSAAATTEPCSSNPLGLSSTPSNPSISSSYSHNRNPNLTTHSRNNSTKHYPNCANLTQSANPHTHHFPHNSIHNPYSKTYGNQQQHTPMSNQAYSLQLLHPHTEAQSNLFEFMSTKSSKASSSPLWRSSKCESESSDSDPSPPRADHFMNSIHKRPRTHMHDHFQVLPRCKAGLANFHGCVNGMPGYLGGAISGEISHAHLNSTNEDMDWDEHKQIFARDKNLICAEDIDTLTHDQHLMRTSHSYHHNYRGGGFMDALMGINDDIIMNPSEHMESMASSNYNNHNVSPFDFNVEASLGLSMMQVDEFPLISELSGKLEEAEGGLNHYVNLHDEEGSHHSSSSSSSNIVNDSAHDNAKLSGNLDGNLVCGINSDLEMKRMRFERRASASLYALNGVHEMAMKQTPSHNPGTNYLAGNSTSTSFNFLSTSPSYMLSSSWKPSSALSTTSTCDDSSALNASNVNGAFINTCDDSSALNASTVINTPSLMPSSNSSLSSCPSDTNNAPNNNSTLTFSNMGSDTSNGTTKSSTNNNSSDAQSQEAAMWNSWDLAPLCTLVA